MENGLPKQPWMTLPTLSVLAAGEPLKMYLTIKVLSVRTARAPVGPRLTRKPGTSLSGGSPPGFSQRFWLVESSIAKATEAHARAARAMPTKAAKRRRVRLWLLMSKWVLPFVRHPPGQPWHRLASARIIPPPDQNAIGDRQLK